VVDPGPAPLPHLLLPDGDDLFQAIDSVGARLESRLAMRRADGDRHGAFTPLQMSPPVHDGDVIDSPLFTHFIRDLLHLANGHLPVGFIFQIDDVTAAGEAADDPQEGHEAAVRTFTHVLYKRLELQL